MLALTNETCVKVVDTQLSLRSLLEDVTSLPTNPPSLFLGLEGNNLGRHVSISIISLLVIPKKTAYLIDIHRLGSEAFTLTNNNKVSFKTILESSATPKVFFDVRNDAKLRRSGVKFWEIQVQHAMRDRIKLSQTPHFDGQDKSKTLGPWIEGEIDQAREEWNKMACPTPCTKSTRSGMRHHE